MRTLSLNANQSIGQKIEVKGWVQTRRDHGGLIFIDLRDHLGTIQLVINPEHNEAFKLAEHLRDEFVIAAEGVVKQRSPELANPKLETGNIEVVVEDLKLLNKANALPIQIFSEAQAGEELRFKYRYLDLRRPVAQDILRKRAKYYNTLRTYMEDNEFIEVTTPILANSSPEGARDFLVPSRVHPGKFYALPQAPQQFKQLLMVGGVPRYYQIATCFRDEDPRADRLYGDFYQLDLEMAFVDDGEEVRRTMEPLIKQLVEQFAGKKLLSQDIPRLSYSESMDRFGTDKPDLRFEMELVDLTSELAQSEFSVFSSAVKGGGVVKAICVKTGASFSRSQIDKYTEIAKSEGAKGLAYISLQEQQLKSPILKFLSEEEQNVIKSKVGLEEGDIVFFGADSKAIVNKTLGRLRNEFAEELKLKDPDTVALVWVVDFPFYEYDNKTKKLDFGHNPFSMPLGGVEALKAEDKTSIIADQFDMVMNGYEICSGAVRNHNPEVMYQVFETLGYDKHYVDSKFGAMINAFKFGAPPHAGCAFGLDRIFMVLIGEDNIREVVAFPKNGSGVDTMMNSPSEVEPAQLKELNIRTNI
ncbi:MAG TPA: aspartate--tRNA ligase [Candidatus Saccharimonadales bacterium]